LGCTQIGVAALASSGVGLFDSNGMVPIVVMLAGTSLVAFLILMAGMKRIGAKIITGSGSPESISH
jgi:DHA1 family bicyclomycin/chloramphenicol resistance-like MFS transporter